MPIKRRLKSVTAPKAKKKLPVTEAMRKQRLKAKQHYAKNKTKIRAAAKVRRKKLTTAEKLFNKRRAEFLRKTRKSTPKKLSLVKRVVKHFS